MEEEREELTRRYFPSIHHLCNSHGLQFAAVDMRWGITSESSDNAQVISICLREIDRSDMFIGFFGQRYGWHGEDDASLQKNFDNAVLLYPWLDKFRDKSVTELEFLHGFLNDPGRLPAAIFFRDKRYGWHGEDDASLQKNFDNAVLLYPWLDKFRDKSVTELEFLHGFLNDPGHLPAAIFFRDKQYDDMVREEALAKGDKKQVFKYSAESEHSTRLMNDLKERVSKQKEKSLGVYMDYKTPAEAAKIMYETIMSYLRDTLLVNFTTEKLTLREELLREHDAFLSSRCNIFVHGEIYLKQLNKHLLSEQGKNTLVVGEAGSGKSALLCNWISFLQNDKNSYIVVYHFIGYADGSTDVNSMLTRITEEFNYELSKMLDGSAVKQEDQEESITEKTHILMQRLLAALDKVISIGKTPVIVLDGLDKIINVSVIKKVLFWLPTHFPTSAMIVLSTKDSDTATIDELRNRKYHLIHVDPLPNEYKHEMCVKTLRETGKELSPTQLDRIVTAEMTKNPLFLKITLCELVAFGYFRLLDKKIDSLITSESIEALFLQVLKRLEEDYNVDDYHGNLVEQVMSCIMLSSQGLSETEIKQIFSIPDHVWSPFYFAIEKLIISHSGRIQFGYKELGKGVETKYLTDVDKKQFYLKKLVANYTVELQKLDQSDCLHGENLKVFSAAHELPHLILQLGDTEQLIKCLSNFFVFSHLESKSPYRLIQLWHHTCLHGVDIAKKLLESFDKRISEIYLQMEEEQLLEITESPGLRLFEYLMSVDHVLTIGGYTEARKKVIERAIIIATDGIEQGRGERGPDYWEDYLMSLKYKLACIYCESYHTAEQGIQLHKDYVKYHESKHHISPEIITKLGHAYHGIGVGYHYLQKYEETRKYMEKSLEYHEKSGIGSEIDLGASLSIISSCLLKQDEFQKALEYQDKAIEAYETYYLGENPPVIGEMLANKAMCLRHLGRMDEAEAMYQRSLDVKIKAVGRDHDIVAMTFLNLSALEGIRKNYEKSIEHIEEALQIYRTLGETLNNPKYIAALENRLMAFVCTDNFARADEDFMTLLEWRLSDGSMDNCLGTVYLDMGRYYLREEMYEKAYKVLYALIGSRFREHNHHVTYILLDIACEHLPLQYYEQLPEDYRIAYAFAQEPKEVSLMKTLVCSHLIPSNNIEEVVRVINQHEDQVNAPEVFLHTLNWFVDSDGQINEELQQAILSEGLMKYPDNLDLHLTLAKSYCRINKQDLALPHAVKVAEKQLENPQLLLFTAHTAALSENHDVCSKWCSYILENFSDESITTPVQNILKVIDDKTEYQRQEDQPTNQEQSSNNEHQ